MTRYDFAPLAALMGLSPHAALQRLGVTGTREVVYRRDGVTATVADRLAVRAGFHPYEVWPEMAEHDQAAELERWRKFERDRKRRRYRRPDVRCRELARKRRYYAECAEVVKAKRRRRYAERQEVA